MIYMDDELWIESILSSIKIGISYHILGILCLIVLYNKVHKMQLRNIFILNRCHFRVHIRFSQLFCAWGLLYYCALYSELHDVFDAFILCGLDCVLFISQAMPRFILKDDYMCVIWDDPYLHSQLCRIGATY